MVIIETRGCLGTYFEMKDKLRTVITVYMNSSNNTSDYVVACVCKAWHKSIPIKLFV